ncbi:hypothetical protein ACHAXM_000531 [Skeletonema potamos]
MLGLKENRIGCGKLCFKDKEAAFQSRNSVTYYLTEIHVGTT